MGKGDVRGRLSVCYVAPGHRLVPTTGTTRNMLSLADALSEFADVTLAFRRIPSRGLADRRVVAIEPGGPDDGDAADDVAQLGLNPVNHLAYLRRLAAFARDCGQTFDVILEKSWRLSGTLVSAFSLHGVPGVLVENDVRSWPEPIGDLRTALRYTLHLAARAVTRRHARHMLIIAETDELKAMLVRRGADPGRVRVIGLGVDHRVFRPQDQNDARRVLGIDLSAPVLVYVGAMDVYHDVHPVIEALPAAPRGLQLHIVGDGVGRTECEELAGRLGAAVKFHGRVPHASVPTYIAAADACVAAYRERAFAGGVIPFSTLKIPEYMACARTVVGNAAGEARALLDHGISALLFRNDVSAWTRFFEEIPSRAHLAEMGRAAAKAAESLSWTRTAARYFEVCEFVVAERRRRS